MFTIEDTVKLPVRRKQDSTITNAVNRYQRLYRLTYGKEPRVNVQEPWIDIEGHASRVKLFRLKELIKQLELRLDL